MTLLRWLTFLLGSQTVTLIVLLFWIFFLLLTLVFILQWLFLYWQILCDHVRDVPWEAIFNLSATAASEICEWVQVGIDVYIPHCKYQVKPHSSPWFSAAFVAAIVHRNHFFCLNQKDKSSDFKLKFRQASNCCKKVLEIAKLVYANKTKESITSQKLGSWDFWGIADSVLNKGKSAIPPLFNDPVVLSSASNKAKLFPENFSKNAT